MQIIHQHNNTVQEITVNLVYYREQSLSPCAKVIDIESFISRCLETTCACLQKSKDNHTSEEECRCQSLQGFVVDCLSADNTIDISEWRIQQDCRK